MQKRSNLYGKITFKPAERQLEAVHFSNLSDAEKKAVYIWRTAPETARWMRTADFSLQNHLKFIETLADRTDCYYWLVGEDDRPLGVIYLTGIAGGQAELGIYTVPGVRGAGSELMSVIFYLAFAELGLGEIRAEVYEDNRAARRLYEKCGMKLEPQAAPHCKQCTRTTVCVYTAQNPDKGTN